MTADQITILVVLFALLVLLIWGKWRYDVVALAALFVSALAGLVPEQQLFAGFGHPATITVVLVLILSYGLTRSGAIEGLARLIDPVADRPLLHIAVLTFLAAFLSMFMNNVGALALLMPVAIQSTNKAGRSPATVLMPLSFGSILGGMATSIGTPPNIIIATYRGQTTGEPFAMFDFAPVGGSVALAGILFMLLIGWRLVKVRKNSAGLELFDVEKYLFELKVTEGSTVAGQSVRELEKSLAEGEIDLLALIHQDHKFSVVPRMHTLTDEDLLLVQGSQDEIDKLVSKLKLQLLGADSAQKEILHSKDSQVSEIVITPGSRLEGRSVGQVRFKRLYGVNLLAISREGKPYRNRLRDFVFRVGDVLLLHGESEDMPDAISKLDGYPLAERQLDFGKRDKAMPALAIFFAAIALAVSGLMSIQLALGAATVAMVLAKVLPVRELYDGVNWSVVVLLGAMIPIGGALETTGTAAVLVDGLLTLTQGLHPVLMVSLLLVITMTVSDVLNNAATAVLMAPIAYSMAMALGLNPDAFLMAVAVGASCAFLTPIGHQNNALVMGPGGYRFGDFWRMGLPLELLIVAVATPLIVLVWPL